MQGNYEQHPLIGIRYIIQIALCISKLAILLETENMAKSVAEKIATKAVKKAVVNPAKKAAKKEVKKEVKKTVADSKKKKQEEEKAKIGQNKDKDGPRLD